MHRIYTVEERETPRGTYYSMDGKIIGDRAAVGRHLQQLINYRGVTNDNATVRVIKHATPTEIATWARFERPKVVVREEVMAMAGQ